MIAGAACVVSIAIALADDARSAEASTPERLLVVAPEAYRSALAGFLLERGEQLGAPVAFLALEDATRVPPDSAAARPADAPELLKREVHRRWRAGEVTALLLVGDVDTLPIRFMKLDRGTKEAFD
ncbi:MAG: hypothetical protein ACK5C3_02765, partial [bacterium]